MAQYTYVFTPLKVGHTTIKNRIIFGPHVTNMFPNFLPGERARAYYEERAKGGVGMIITGAQPVDEKADYYPYTQMAMWSDDVIEPLRRVTDTIHKYDCKFLTQLVHPGVHQPIDRNLEYPARAPSQVSAIEEPHMIPKELEKEEIVEIEQKFAAAADRAKKAGCDGAEIHGAHGYLISQFLTPLNNKRTDEYGGTPENRFRFCREVIDIARDRVGRNFVLGIRISNNDMYPGGLETEDMVQIARWIEETGKIDYINVSTGLYRSYNVMIPTHYTGLQPGYQAEFTSKIKEAVKAIPVFQTGRINSPSLIDRLIADGKCDGAIIVRQLIAEPEFANKAREGREDDIRPCMYCNQNCIAYINMGLPVGCNGNAATGYERELGIGTVKRAGQRKKILIIGAGPAGLECARIAAERGHEPVIYERADKVGGQVGLFIKMPGRIEVQDYISWLERQCKKQGVRINFGQEITEANMDSVLGKERPDAIVVATGAKAARDGRSAVTTEPIPGWQQDHVITYEEVILGRGKLGDRVLVVDELNDRIAPGVAEMAASQGKQVELITRWMNIGYQWLWFWNEMTWINARLDELRVKVVPNTWVKNISKGTVTCYNIFSGREWTTEADNVVLATMRYSTNNLYHLLKRRGVKNVYHIGDAVAPRKIYTSIRDGDKLARML